MDLTSGTVSDHKLVPSLAGIVLTEDLRSCLLQVLSAPAYRLSRATTEAPAPQISIVIEF